MVTISAAVVPSAAPITPRPKPKPCQLNMNIKLNIISSKQFMELRIPGVFVLPQLCNILVPRRLNPNAGIDNDVIRKYIVASFCIDSSPPSHAGSPQLIMAPAAPIIIDIRRTIPNDCKNTLLALLNFFAPTSCAT